MSFLSQVKSARVHRPRLTVLYGQHGIGKSTFASKFPKPIFIRTEDGIDHLDVAAFPLCTDYMDARAQLQELVAEGADHDFETIVLDSADWLELLINKHVCEEGGVESIGDFDFGRGYAKVTVKFKHILDGLTYARSKGMHVIVLAHAEIVPYHEPGKEAYDTWQPKLSKRLTPLLQEWADEVLFARYEHYEKTVKEGFGKERTIPVGDSRRMLLTTKTAVAEAKNRLGLPETIPLSFDEYWPFISKQSHAG